MKHNTATSIARVLMIGVLLVLAAGGVATAQPRVLATTAWTAAFAHLAGAQQVELLAPYEMRHPPEYELRATDLRRVQEADLVVYAGYERMMDRLFAALSDRSGLSAKITTVHTMAIIEESAMTIAAALGTEQTARENIAELRRFMEEWRSELQTYRLHRQPVLVHTLQAPLLEDLGINVVGRFGPAHLEAQQISRLSQTRPALVIDNWHNEVATPLRETLPGVPVVSFINFPGHSGTRTLLDVMRFNRQTLTAELDAGR